MAPDGPRRARAPRSWELIRAWTRCASSPAISRRSRPEAVRPGRREPRAHVRRRPGRGDAVLDLSLCRSVHEEPSACLSTSIGATTAGLARDLSEDERPAAREVRGLRAAPCAKCCIRWPSTSRVRASTRPTTARGKRRPGRPAATRLSAEASGSAVADRRTAALLRVVEAEVFPADERLVGRRRRHVQGEAEVDLRCRGHGW